MFNYRFTALVLPTFLLIFLPAMAAYPWHFPLGNALALPFLTLLTILFATLRYPGLLLSPLVFLSGLICDLATRSPLGFWILLFLITLSCARTTSQLVVQRGLLMGSLGFGVILVLIPVCVWGLSSLYQFEWQNPDISINGMIMAVILFPLPFFLFLGLEKAFILKKEDGSQGAFGQTYR